MQNIENYYALLTRYKTLRQLYYLSRYLAFNPLSHELWIMNILKFFCYFLVQQSLIKKKKIKIWAQGYLGCQIWHVSSMIPYDSTGRKRNQILVSYMIPYDSTGRKGNQLLGHWRSYQQVYRARVDPVGKVFQRPTFSCGTDVAYYYRCHFITV